MTISGVKIVESDGGGLDALRDTTTLFVRVFEGDVSEAGEAMATVRGTGVIHIEFFDFLQQMTTFRAEGPSAAAEVQALGRFGGLFFGKLWDVYGPAGSRLTRRGNSASERCQERCHVHDAVALPGIEVTVVVLGFLCER